MSKCKIKCFEAVVHSQESLLNKVMVKPRPHVHISYLTKYFKKLESFVQTMLFLFGGNVFVNLTLVLSKSKLGLNKESFYLKGLLHREKRDYCNNEKRLSQ